MGINAYNYPIPRISLRNNLSLDEIRQKMKGNTTIAGSLPCDTYTKTEVISPGKRELERLFPDGEIYKIYNNIVKEFGLKNPPSFEIADLGDNNGMNSAVYNKIIFNPDFLCEDDYKMLIEKNGKSFYATTESGNLITMSKDKIPDFTRIYSKMGFKVKTALCTDDDKKKLAIFTIAHELGHSKQYELIAQTEGLDLKNIYLSRSFAREKNLISRKQIELTLNNAFSTNGYGKMDKIYTKESEEGKLAYQLYNAGISYSQPDANYNDYKYNLMERNADESALNYLIKHNYNFEGTNF